MPLLEARHLGFAYPGAAPVLEDFSLTLEPGEICTLLGANGAGKSTALWLLAGRLRPQRGNVTLDGKPLADYDGPARAQKMAILPQTADSAMPYTVTEIVRMGRYQRAGWWDAAARAEDERAITAALARLDLTALRERDFSRLSGGERQRTLLAAALAQEPQVLLLDEPTAALDLGHAAALMRHLGKLRAEGLAVLVITHDIGLAARHADKVAVLNLGRVAACGRPGDIITPDLIREVYGVRAEVVKTAAGIAVFA